MTHGLASVFVNNQRVEDLDNPELRIRDIIRTYGREPERCIVYRLNAEEEVEGQPVDLDERVDLAELSGSLYLRCETRRTEAMAPSPAAAGREGEGLAELERVPTFDTPSDDTLTAEEHEQEELWGQEPEQVAPRLERMPDETPAAESLNRPAKRASTASTERGSTNRSGARRSRTRRTSRNKSASGTNTRGARTSRAHPANATTKRERP